MAEYIERDKAIRALQFRCRILKTRGAKTAADIVERYAIRTIANKDSVPNDDVWEFVHCADCVHAEESLVNGCVYCNEMERARNKAGFCAWGERRMKDG